jgi:small subunit ribosomal protein S16
LAVRMRLTRVGSTKNPVYRIVVVDSRARRDGRAIETIGQYNPQMDPSLIEIDADKAKKWLGEGAQPSRTVKKLLSIKGIDK